MRVFVCATVLIVRIAFAAEPATPASPFVLLDASKSLEWDDVRGGRAALFLSNQTDKPRTAIASLAPFQPDTGVGAPLDWVQRKVALAIPAHDIVRIPLLPALGASVAGGYSGLVVVEETGGKSSPLIQPIRITATGAQPAVSKLTVTLTRLIPFTRVYWRTRIPIPFTSGPMPRLAPTALVNDSGGWTRVHWRGGDGKEQDFEADPPGHSGAYHGDMAFAAGAEKTTVALTLLTRDFVLWPIAVIAIGTWFAYLVKRFLGLRRITLDLREQEAKLGDGFRRAQARFIMITAGKPYAAYDLAQDVDEKRRDVLNQLDRLDGSRVTVLDANSETYKDAVAGLQALTAAISEWNALGGEVDTLAGNLSAVANAVDGAVIEPPRSAPSPPDFYPPAIQFLDGKPITIAELTDLRKNIAAANSLARAWPDAHGQLAAITEDYRAILNDSEITPEQAKQLPDLLNRVVALWGRLQRVKTPADLEGLTKFDGELNAARELADQIAARPKPRKSRLWDGDIVIQQVYGAPGGRGGRIGSLLGTRLGEEERSFTVASPLSDERRAELARAAIQRGDLGSAVFAGVIALLTGLNTYYIGKAFGTIGDYVTLFLWAAGTKAALDILAAALDKMTRVATPVSAPPQPQEPLPRPQTLI